MTRHCHTYFPIAKFGETQVNSRLTTFHHHAMLRSLALLLLLSPAAVFAGLFGDSPVKMLDPKGFKKVMKNKVSNGVYTLSDYVHCCLPKYCRKQVWLHSLHHGVEYVPPFSICYECRSNLNQHLHWFLALQEAGPRIWKSCTGSCPARASLRCGLR